MRDVNSAPSHGGRLPAYIPEAFFYLTIAVSLCSMIALGAQGIRAAPLPHSPFLDWLTYTVDTLFVQVLLAFAVSCAIGLLIFLEVSARLCHLPIWQRVRSSRVPRILTAAVLLAVCIAAGAAFVLLLMGVEFDLERRFFKPSFFVARPDDALPDPPFTTLLEGWLGADTGEKPEFGSGAPSGYVLRQWWLFMLVVVVTEQLVRRAHDDRLRAWYRLLVYGVVVLSVVYVALSRVYRMHHTLFDVGIAIGLGTFVFWLVAVVPGAILNRDRRYITELGGSAFAYLFLFFFYSESSYRWVIGALVVFAFLALVYLLAERRESRRTLYRKAQEIARKG